MIQDVALRWVVTLLFVFSAGVCVRAVATQRHSAAGVISHSLHAIMAIAMAVMAWPPGAALPARAPMIFFVGAAAWFVVAAVRQSDQRGANAYHVSMMAAMAWMYAEMGGLPLPAPAQADAGSSGLDAPPMPGMAASAGHARHSGHSGGGGVGVHGPNWVDLVNWMLTIGFGAAAAWWLYRLITERLQPEQDGPHRTVGILCQFAMAAGMAIMFSVTL